MGKLDGKVIVVTGSSRGIGRAIAELFAAEGGRVICAGRTEHEGDSPITGSLTSTVAAIREAGGEATAVRVNISDEQECIRLIEEAKRIYGPVDVLVNNAVMNHRGRTVDYPVKRWMLGFAVNIHAPFHLSRAVLPDMIEKGRGAIVNISSGVAIGPGRGPYTGKDQDALGAMYGVTKAALERFTQGLALEVTDQGIAVTALSPSQAVLTEAATFHGTPEGIEEEPASTMAQAALLLATEPVEKVAGRVTYSQQILKEFGWIEQASGSGVDRPGSGFSQI